MLPEALNRMSISLLAALGISLSGCASIISVPQTCSIDSVWSEEIQSLAQDVWLYAQLSRNTYHKTPFYSLPANVTMIDFVDNDKSGMAYSFFQISKFNSPDEVVIAFRGTEPGAFFDDWLWGNVLGQQNDNALDAYHIVLDRYGFEPDGQERPIIVTGHSLGGALATHISLNAKNASSHVFNSSPRFWNIENFENERTSTVEYGEPLKLLRLFGPEPTQLYTSVNCSTDKSLRGQHSMKNLADCLTAIAAEDDPDAKLSKTLNKINLSFGNRPPCKPSKVSKYQ